MSINQIVNQNPKKWLDGHVGGVIVDGDLIYDESNKAVGDVLELDSNKIARWQPNSDIHSGSVFVGRIANTPLSSSVITCDILALFPFPSIYSIFNGNSVRVSEAGDYLVIATLFSTDSIAQISCEIARNGFAAANTRSSTGGSNIVSYNKRNNCSYEILKLNAGDLISVVANASAITQVYASGSCLNIIRLQ